MSISNKPIFRIFFIILAFAITPICLNAQSLMDAANKAQQESREKKAQEETRYRNILDSRDLNLYRQYIKDYPYGRHTGEIKKRVAEIEDWNKAKQTNTIEAYRAYLDNSSYRWYASQAQSRINDIQKAQELNAWNKVKAIGTPEAFQEYLRQNPNSAYRQEAQDSINRLLADREWGKICNSDNASDYTAFISTFPNASQVPNAKAKAAEITAMQLYNNGDLKNAYYEFGKIPRDKLSATASLAYSKCIEYHKYSLLNSSSDEYELERYLKEYPYGPYSDQVKEWLAVARSKNLGEYATNSDYNKVRSYAKTSESREAIEYYIDLNKKKQKERQKQLKSWQRKENGGTINIGWELFNVNFGFNDYEDDIYTVEMGLRFRFGNYKDRFQLAFGVHPGAIILSEPTSYYGYKEDKAYFHLPVSAQLKLRLFSHLHIFGKFKYNIFRVEDVETPMNWGAGLGFAWKHIDWDFYYQQDIGYLNNYTHTRYIGMALTYFWCL